jgi:hypothetical protein
VRWNAWWLSCKLAWAQVTFRIVSLLIALVVIGGTIFFVGETIAIGRHHPTLAIHYNVYVGIDDVRPWQWGLLLPLGWFLFSTINTMIAYVFYRRDPQAAMSLLLFTALACIPWISFLFYLTVLNR